MKILFKFTALFTAFAFLLCSCATSRQPGQQTQWSSPEACIVAHTVGGAVLGAIGGALFGALNGGGKKKVAQSAAIGSAAGGVLAFAYAWGACFAAFTKVKSEQTQGYSEAKKQIGYQSQQGSVAKIKEYTIDPAAIAPGDKPTLHASYYVMTPENKEITVTETVALKIFNPDKNIFEEVGKSSETIVVTPGKRKATSEIPIPPNAEEGKFFIVFRINIEGKTDQKEMPLTITKNQEILAKARNESSYREEQAPTPSPKSTEPSSTNMADNGSKAVTTTSDKQIEITANSANLRENPDTKSKIVTKASKGNKYILQNTVKISGKQWYQIKLDNNATAWVLASLSKVLE